MSSHSSKPLLVYDNDCDFCRYWIAQWQHTTDDRIDYAPYQEVASQFPDIPISAFKSSVQLILENGTVHSGAEAVFRALDNTLLLQCYNRLPGFANVSESVYRLVAENRPFFSTLTRWFWGTHTERTAFPLLALAVSPCYRVYLSHRLSVTVGADSRTHRKQRHFTGRTIVDGCSSRGRHIRLSRCTDAALAESVRCLPASLVCWWRCSVSNFNRRLLSHFYFSGFMGILFVACVGRSGFSEFPMGCTAVRDGVFGNFFRAVSDP